LPQRLVDRRQQVIFNLGLTPLASDWPLQFQLVLFFSS